MSFSISVLSLTFPMILLAFAVVPTRWANQHVAVMSVVAKILASAILAWASALVVSFAWMGPVDKTCLEFAWPIAFGFGAYLDVISVSMLSLISFIGWVIIRYSVCYLSGENRQGRFLKWMLFTLGAVLLLVLSGNLVMFTLAWMLTSSGLHQLLTHYPERQWAIWAARKKFLISRLGDLLLLLALGMTVWTIGSIEFRDIFAAAERFRADSDHGGLRVAIIGVLFVLGAMTKSAQLPFHSWLPDTMETPTPVSALMHAGIINAGGFLVVRLSPLIALSSAALDLLAVIGALTALFGAVVMLTQTSVKRALAYSTMAQMGFMMLQCGLGAFSAALLHIVAHSLYKAHAFLSSGSVLESAARTSTQPLPPTLWSHPGIGLPLSLALGIVVSAASGWLLGVDPSSKPGAVLLGVILAIAVSQLIWSGLATGSPKLTGMTLLGAGAVCGLYYLGYRVFDGFTTGTLPRLARSWSALELGISLFVLLGFLGVLWLQSSAVRGWNRPWLQALYVHALNGFYLDIPARRLTARLYGHSAPVP